MATEEKSNEITAIPVLLRQLDLKKAAATIDAMGRQKDIARDILGGGGDFVIAVKGNQPNLSEAIGALVIGTRKGSWQLPGTGATRPIHAGTVAGAKRVYRVVQVPPDFAARDEWSWIKVIGAAARITTHADGPQTHKARC